MALKRSSVLLQKDVASKVATSLQAIPVQLTPENGEVESL